MLEPPLALAQAWSSAWADFLANKVAVAERRAAPWVSALSAEGSSSSAAGADAESLVMVADLAHICGAVREDPAILRRALAAYDAHLALAPTSQAGLRMRAETLLRLGETREAFEAFDVLYHVTLEDVEAQANEEVAPFRLLHDAECVEDAVRLGADPSALEMSAAWRALAAELADNARVEPERNGRGEAPDAVRRTPIRSLSAAQRALLGASYGRPLPVPPCACANREAAASGTLRPRSDWAGLERKYVSERCVVIDDLLSADALAELQQYARHGCHFRTMRAGFLGAFPADGVTHPLLQTLVHELTAAVPTILGGHALGLWWLFKYSDSNPEGIGIHADPAAVNMNLWLTEDDACLDGGGLRVYTHVPPLEQPTSSNNREFGPGEEGALRARLQAGGGVVTVPYRCNRAVIFVSDQYHESLPFRFAPGKAPGYEQRRVNLTLLFGDRWSKRLAHPDQDLKPSSAVGIDASAGWDVFDD